MTAPPSSPRMPRGLEAVVAAEAPPIPAAARGTLEAIPRSPDEILLAYWRPDGDYAAWNLWTWGADVSGRHAFTGVAGDAGAPGAAVAYLRVPRSRLFHASAARLGFLVRTDSWAKDPGNDMTWDFAAAPACLVVSGRPEVYALGGDTPRIAAAAAVEVEPGRFVLRVRTAGRLRLSPAAAASSAGFRLARTSASAEGRGVRIASVAAWTEGGEVAARETDDLRLTLAGPVPRDIDLALTHPLLAGRVSVRLPPEPVPAPPLSAAVRRALPEPVLDEHPEWIELYWDAWRFMHEKLTRGDVTKGFVPLYIDEGFNENIFQWDSCFMAAYAIYGLKVFPAMAALDNFYNHQRASDGYICRCYNEETGRATGEADINPPLFAWLEWRYWRATGDASRLPRVLPVLDRYFQWVKANARGPRGQGLYFITDLGSGMDNSPREAWIKQGAWIDISAQQALAALSIARLATAAGDRALAMRYGAEFSDLSRAINETLWNDELGNYYDKREDGTWHTRPTIASFWPMLAEIAPDTRMRRMIDGHLKNPSSFRRPHLFPTLAADDPDYDPRGHYWRGGVWAPTTYATIKGIERLDRAFAREAAENHIAAMSRVHRTFRPDPARNPLPSLTEPNIARNGDGRRQIWEAYSPEQDAPATRWDARLLVRQKFCGWSGLGPVALLVENVLGFDRDVPARTLTWRIARTGRHGIRRLDFGDGAISLVAAARRRASDTIVITGRSTRPVNGPGVRLVVYRGDEATPCLERELPANKPVRWSIPGIGNGDRLTADGRRRNP